MTQTLEILAVQIIRCSVRDAQAISDIAVNSYKDFYLHLWYDGGAWYINHSFNKTVIEEELMHPNHIFFLINEDNGTIGFLKLNIDRPLKNFEGRDAIELGRIYLTKSSIGKGIGRSVMKFCFDYARQLNKELIWLKAMDTSDAVGFYEALGFKHYGRLRLEFPQMKEEFRGMVVMMKELSRAEHVT